MVITLSVVAVLVVLGAIIFYLDKRPMPNVESQTHLDSATDAVRGGGTEVPVLAVPEPSALNRLPTPGVYSPRQVIDSPVVTPKKANPQPKPVKATPKPKSKSQERRLSRSRDDGSF